MLFQLMRAWACLVCALQAFATEAMRDDRVARTQVDATMVAGNEPGEETKPTWAGYQNFTGSVDKGRELFLNSPSIACNSCHSLTPDEVFVGPSLAGIGSRQDPLKIAQSVTNPSAEIAAGFPTHLLIHDGRLLEGRIASESPTSIALQLESGDVLIVPRIEIEEVKLLESGMPSNAADKLSPQELADLVAFLSSLKEAPESATGSPPSVAE